MQTVWITPAGQGPAAHAAANALATALESLGVAAARGTGDGAAGVVVVVEAGCDAGLCVAQAVRRGERVLAVATSRAALEGGAALALLRAGAADVLVFDGGRDVAGEIAARLARWAEVDRLLAAPAVAGTLVGESPGWRARLARLAEAAAFGTGSVVLLGETGTGKELAARLVHLLDRRPAKRDLVVVDCTTLAAELAGSELFGHERGAYTGAAGPRDGAVALADGGTLFLDEVGELPLPLQAQLLRLIQERTYKRVGGNAWHEASFRLVCATNRDLEAEVRAGRFRADLYHRIATFVLRLPPLRERREDVLPLARHFLRAARPDVSGEAFDPAVEEVLVAREYPGNVRDLRQLVTRVAERHVGSGPVTPGDLDPVDRPSPEGWHGSLLELAIRHAVQSGANLREIGRVATALAVRVVVEQEGGNLQRAARKLGVTDRALQLRRAPRRATA
jgi:transcriptional regulator with GAF, ATPase, and Fis domain